MAQVRGHKLKLGKPKNGIVDARCTCGGWKATGTATEVTLKWNKNHISKFDNYR